MSRPLRRQAGRIVAVDAQASMLAMVDADERIEGRWPEIASDVGQADVVVCGHVVYNVADLEPFVLALDIAARVRAVIEMTAVHPLTGSAWLWRLFWGIDRPSGPSWRDAEAVMREAGIEPHVEEWSGNSGFFGFPTRESLVAFHRKRLCLPPARDDDVWEAMRDRVVERNGRWLPNPDPRPMVTLWWDPVLPSR